MKDEEVKPNVEEDKPIKVEEQKQEEVEIKEPATWPFGNDEVPIGGGNKKATAFDE